MSFLSLLCHTSRCRCTCYPNIECVARVSVTLFETCGPANVFSVHLGKVTSWLQPCLHWPDLVKQAPPLAKVQLFQSVLSIICFPHSDILKDTSFKVYTVHKHFIRYSAFQLHHYLILKRYPKTRWNINVLQLFGHFLPSLYVDFSAPLHMENSVGILSRQTSLLPLKQTLKQTVPLCGSVTQLRVTALVQLHKLDSRPEQTLTKQQHSNKRL